MAPSAASNVQAKALVALIDSLDLESQRAVIRSLWSRFGALIDEEEDRLLAQEAHKEHERWVRSGRKTIPAGVVRRELEKSGTL